MSRQRKHGFGEAGRDWNGWARRSQDGRGPAPVALLLAGRMQPHARRRCRRHRQRPRHHARRHGPHVRRAVGRQAAGPAASPEQADSLRLNVVRELIEEEIVEQRAAKMNLTATTEDVDAKLAEMKAPYTEEQFAAAVEGLQPHARRCEARPAPLADHRQAAEQGDQLQGHRHRRRHRRLLQPAQGGVRPHRDPVPPGRDPRHQRALGAARQPAGQQGDQRRRGEEEDPGAEEPAGRRRRLRRAGDELLREPETASNGGDMGFVPETQLQADPDGLRRRPEAQARPDHRYPSAASTRRARRPLGYAIYKLI